MWLQCGKDYYLPYVQADGAIAVNNNKLMFGYVEVTHCWYESFAKVFLSNVWKKCMKDKSCVCEVKDKLGVCEVGGEQSYYL
jgi:hypothetical protein